MDRRDIPFLSAAERSRLIARKAVSPVEAAEACLERIDRRDGRLHSYVTLRREEAFQSAREAERAIAGGNHLGLPHGIPVAVKDRVYIQGIRTTAGSKILWAFVPGGGAFPPKYVTLAEAWHEREKENKC